MKIVAENRRAYHDYQILEKFEAGIVLSGDEVRPTREGRANLKGGAVKILNEELWLLGAHFGGSKEPERTRKLLVHKNELKKLFGKGQLKGHHLIPLRLYFKKNFLKLEFGLGKIRKMYDKREAIKKREWEREMSNVKVQMSKLQLKCQN